MGPLRDRVFIRLAADEGGVQLRCADFDSTAPDDPAAPNSTAE